MRNLTWALVAFSILSSLGCVWTQGRGGALGGDSSGEAHAAATERPKDAREAVPGRATAADAAKEYIGHYLDQQAALMKRDLQGAKVERVGEEIKITFESGMFFGVNEVDLQPVAKHNLTELAEILNRYRDTDILIEGHTDSQGSANYNLSLSEKRARSVSYFLLQQKVSNPRLRIVGRGESQPVGDNATAAGRDANRRVEIAIRANELVMRGAQSLPWNPPVFR